MDGRMDGTQTQVVRDRITKIQKAFEHKGARSPRASHTDIPHYVCEKLVSERHNQRGVHRQLERRASYNDNDNEDTTILTYSETKTKKEWRSKSKGRSLWRKKRNQTPRLFFLLENCSCS